MIFEVRVKAGEAQVDLTWAFLDFEIMTMPFFSYFLLVITNLETTLE